MNPDFKLYLAVIPVVLLNLVMVIWCVADWYKRKRFRLLDKKVWIFIILFIQLFGSLAYLLAGRGDDND